MNGWTIHAEATGGPGGVDPEALDELLDLLHDRGGSVAGNQDGRTYSATFSHTTIDDDENAAYVAHDAAEIFTTLAEKAGLPTWPITRLEVLTFDEHDAELARPALPELLGVAEVARLFDVSKQRVSEMRQRPGFPAPAADLKSGPVWTRPSLTVFLTTWPRRPGRPRVLCPECGGHLETWGAHGVGARRPGDPSVPLTKGTQHCTDCDRIFDVAGNPFDEIVDPE